MNTVGVFWHDVIKQEDMHNWGLYRLQFCESITIYVFFEDLFGRCGVALLEMHMENNLESQLKGFPASTYLALHRIP